MNPGLGLIEDRLNFVVAVKQLDYGIRIKQIAVTIHP